jgi:hypothetical protein
LHIHVQVDRAADYSAVDGSIIVLTREILLAGNPPSSAWRLTRDASAA